MAGRHPQGRTGTRRVSESMLQEPGAPVLIQVNSGERRTSTWARAHSSLATRRRLEPTHRAHHAWGAGTGASRQRQPLTSSTAECEFTILPKRRPLRSGLVLRGPGAAVSITTFVTPPLPSEQSGGVLSSAIHIAARTRRVARISYGQRNRNAKVGVYPLTGGRGGARGDTTPSLWSYDRSLRPRWAHGAASCFPRSSKMEEKPPKLRQTW